VRPDFSLCCFEVKRVLCPLLKGLAFQHRVLRRDATITGRLVVACLLCKLWRALCGRVQRGEHSRWWGGGSRRRSGPHFHTRSGDVYFNVPILRDQLVKPGYGRVFLNVLERESVLFIDRALQKTFAFLRGFFCKPYLQSYYFFG